MVAYNFDPSFALPIINGVKSSCIKQNGKRAHVAVGELVHAFCGNVAPDWSKSPDCHRLITAPCTTSKAILIDANGATVDRLRMANEEWFSTISADEGFANFGELQAHYDRLHGLPFEGRYIRWAPHKAEFRAAWPLIPRHLYEQAGSNA